MPRPRKYVIDPRTRRTADGLSLHARTGQYYSIGKGGQREYWGSDLIAALDDYRASQTLHPYRQLSDQQAITRLAWDGVAIEDGVTDDMVKQAKNFRFNINNEWLASNPESPLAVLVKTGKSPRSKPAPAVNPSGIKSLKQVGPQWAADKSESDTRPVGRTVDDYLRDWNEFVSIARKHGVNDVADVNKEFLKAYRAKIIKAGEGSANYYSNRFRRVKAIFRHILTEHDVAGVSEERAAYLCMALKMLKAKVTTAPNRWVSKEELHALLAVCDAIARDAAGELQTLQREQAKHGSAKFQSLAARMRVAGERRYLAIQYKAMYLVAVNCMFYPVDLATIPRAAVNFSNGHVHFRRGKTDTVRVGLLLPATLKALKAWEELRQDGSRLLFVNVQGSLWRKKSLHERLVEHKTLAGNGGVLGAGDENGALSWKAFRKGGYRAALQDQRVDQYTAKILAGHQTGITDSYVDANPERCRVAVESIGQFYGL